MTSWPTLTQFRLEPHGDGLVHLIFDCPGRSMNVLSDAAIVDLEAVAAWLPDAEISGLLLRSGKDTAFCAGADLTEFAATHAMIAAARPNARFTLAYDHFFRVNAALRRIETAGKPVAAAIAGLGLGGGCEIALAAHYRVLANDPMAALGLPESLVGLLPGAGGTQRLPRLIGIDAAVPLLLHGARLSGAAALESGLADLLVEKGEEVRAAEAWLRSGAEPVQPWDREDRARFDTDEVSRALTPVRERILRETLGHYPAPLAILDCIAFGLPQSFEGGIRTEMAIFTDLILRPEPHNMLQTLFIAKTDHDRLIRKDALPGFVADAVDAVRAVLEDAEATETTRQAGFGKGGGLPVRHVAKAGYWIDEPHPDARRARALLNRISAAVQPFAERYDRSALAIADYAIVREAGYPSYLGGPFSFGRSRGVY